MKKLIVFIYLSYLICSVGSVLAQRPRSSVSSKLNIESWAGQTGLSVTIPKGFSIIEISGPERFIIPSVTPIDINLKADDQTVIIGFYCMPSKARTSNSPVSMEVNFNRGVNSLIDTIPNFRHDKSGLHKKSGIDDLTSNLIVIQNRQRYNADMACVFNVPLGRPYLNKYWLCKGFAMYNKDYGEVFIFYFYNKDVDIEKYFSNNQNMVAFKAP